MSGSRGGSRGVARGARPPILGKKEEIKEGRKAERGSVTKPPSPSTPLSSRSASASGNPTLRSPRYYGYLSYAGKTAIDCSECSKSPTRRKHAATDFLESFVPVLEGSLVKLFTDGQSAAKIVQYGRMKLQTNFQIFQFCAHIIFVWRSSANGKWAHRFYHSSY